MTLIVWGYSTRIVWGYSTHPGVGVPPEVDLVFGASGDVPSLDQDPFGPEDADRLTDLPGGDPTQPGGQRGGGGDDVIGLIYVLRDGDQDPPD
jgi:hypothetical protein